VDGITQRQSCSSNPPYPSSILVRSHGLWLNHVFPFYLLTFAFCFGLFFMSPSTSTVEVSIFFSTAYPWFFKISATVTTDEMAARTIRATPSDCPVEVLERSLAHRSPSRTHSQGRQLHLVVRLKEFLARPIQQQIKRGI